MYARVFVDTRLCKGCCICKKFCQRGVLGVSDKLNERGVYPVFVEHPETCTGCKLCEVYCPDFAISVEILGKDEIKMKPEIEK